MAWSLSGANGALEEVGTGPGTERASSRRRAKGPRLVAGLRLRARLGSRLSIKHGALALLNDFLIGSRGVALKDIDSPGAPQDCVGYPLTSRRYSWQGVGNGLPQPLVGLVPMTLLLQGPTSGGRAHSQGPPVGGDVSKTEHHHHLDAY